MLNSNTNVNANGNILKIPSSVTIGPFMYRHRTAVFNRLPFAFALAFELRNHLIARKTLQDMSNIWKKKGLSMTLKVHFLKATIFSIALYGSELLAMTKNDRKRIDAF